MAKSHYAVRRGKRPGIYTTWTGCSNQVHGFKGAEYKGFDSLAAAEAWLNEDGGPAPASSGDPVTEQAAQIEALQAQGRALVYVDGSNTSKGGGLASFGVAAYVGTTEVFNSAGVIMGPRYVLKMRNVAGETLGALQALSCLRGGPKPIAPVVHRPPEFERIVLVHDYKGISMWARGLWRAKHPWIRDVYVPRMKAFRDRIDFLWVKGHEGIAGNERADRLAGDALQDHITKYALS